MRSVKFPPKGSEAIIKKDVQMMRDGEPTFVELVRYPNDKTIRGDHWSACCDCGLRHLMSYEVFRNEQGYHLAIRGYADEKTRKRRTRKK